jgi:hypothetical protein
MAVDPTNASNLSSGSVPAAQLGNVDMTVIEDDIALLGFKVASNGSLVKYNLVDQTVDDFQDTSGVSAGSSTNETRNDAGNYYYGSTYTTPTASGGTITTDGLYTIHSFTVDANYINDAAQDVEYLIVGGGAGGGHSNTNSAGGGGAGGYRTATGFAVIAGTFAVDVGDGGAAGSNTVGVNGDTSSFSTIISLGGGGGGSQGISAAGSAGASGGGGAWNGGTGGLGTAGQGNDGGPTINDGTNAAGGGGGGAGAVGGTAYQSTSSGLEQGDGGAGLASTITGASVYYAGGGGGEAYSYLPVSSGGVGGGGDGAAAGTANTGGGGGGGSVGGTSRAAGAGGSGIVIIKRFTNLYIEGNNLTLISTTTAAQAAPTKGDIVFTYTNGAGTTTLGTDVTAEISADGGSNWTAMTLGSEGSTGGHNIATAHNVTIGTVTAPYNMAYRIKTLNQSASKTTRIQAVSLGWS